MAYDKSLDECLFSKSADIEMDRITVSVQQYNKGQKKLQLSRESKNAQDEYKFAKLGRMTKEEVELILPFMQEAIGHME